MKYSHREQVFGFVICSIEESMDFINKFQFYS